MKKPLEAGLLTAIRKIYSKVGIQEKQWKGEIRKAKFKNKSKMKPLIFKANTSRFLNSPQGHFNIAQELTFIKINWSCQVVSSGLKS